jgi:hypothetical protein
MDKWMCVCCQVLLPADTGLCAACQERMLRATMGDPAVAEAEALCAPVPAVFYVGQTPCYAEEFFAWLAGGLEPEG